MTAISHEVQLLHEHVEREQHRLDALVTRGASWWARRRQKRHLDRAIEVLDWSETRAMGQDAFIRQHGILRDGAAIALTLAVGIFVTVGAGSVLEVVATVGLSGLVGLFGGASAAIAQWERAESRLAATLAHLTSTASAELRP